MISERFNALKQLSIVPEPVLRTTLYSLNKFLKGYHLDSLEFVLNVLRKIQNTDKKYLDVCSPLIDLLQQTIFEIDDTLDVPTRTKEEILASETIKIVNPALFFNKILDLIEKYPEDSSRFIKAGKAYCKEVGTLVHTPILYEMNKQTYLLATNKRDEYRKLADTQILKGSHLRVYLYPMISLIDSDPSEKDIEKLVYLSERMRGIEILRKDIKDLKLDEQTESYNPLILIASKYNVSPNSTLVREDLLNVSKLLFDELSKCFYSGFSKKYLESGRFIYSTAQKLLQSLHEELEK